MLILAGIIIVAMFVILGSYVLYVLIDRELEHSKINIDNILEYLLITSASAMIIIMGIAFWLPLYTEVLMKSIVSIFAFAILMIIFLFSRNYKDW